MQTSMHATSYRLDSEDAFEPTADETNVVGTIGNEPGQGKGIFSFPLLAFVFVLVMILVVNTGCAPLTTRGAAPVPTRPGNILFADDFSNAPKQWGIWERDGASVSYFKEGLRIQVNEAHNDIWSVTGQKLEDVIVEVDATLLGGPDNNDFGVICRYQDKDNFYMMVISSDGYYGIAKRQNGQYGMIGAQQLQYNRDAIASGFAPNHLRADCVGSTLRLYVNDKKLMEGQDGDFRAGDVGVIAGAYETAGVDILFDNFVVKKP